MTLPRIEATPGGAECNCYVELVEASSYFASVGRSDEWCAFPPGQQTAALIAATLRIERLPLRGRRADPTTPQALHFPRAEDPDTRVEGAAFLALLDTPVPLAHHIVAPCSERVYAIDGAQVFRPWADYILDCINGAIVARSGGAMADRSPYAISYLCKEVPRAVKQAVCEHALWLLGSQRFAPAAYDPSGSMMWSDVGPVADSAVAHAAPERLSRRGWSPRASSLLKPYVELARAG